VKLLPFPGLVPKLWNKLGIFANNYHPKLQQKQFSPFQRHSLPVNLASSQRGEWGIGNGEWGWWGPLWG
jgi:hypothetical protein